MAAPIYGPPEAQYNPPTYPAPPTAVAGGTGPFPAPPPYPTPPTAVAGGTGPFPTPPTGTGTAPVYTAPSSGDGGGTTTDSNGNLVWITPKPPPWEQLLAGDPWYQNLIGLDKAQSQEEYSAYAARIARLNAYYGSATDPISVYGRLAQNYRDTQQAIVNHLAARGMIFSGGYGSENENARLNYLRSVADAQYRVQEYIQGVHDALAANQRQRLLNELNAQPSVLQRWLDLNPPYQVPGPGGGGQQDGGGDQQQNSGVNITPYLPDASGNLPASGILGVPAQPTPDWLNPYLPNASGNLPASGISSG